MGTTGKTTSTNNLPKFQGRSKVRNLLDTTWDHLLPRARHFAKWPFFVRFPLWRL